MIDQIAVAIATADDGRFQDDPGRFRRLALAALKARGPFISEAFATILLPSGTMIGQVARAIAKADSARFEDDPGRFRRLALAALKPWSPGDGKPDRIE